MNISLLSMRLFYSLLLISFTIVSNANEPEGKKYFQLGNEASSARDFDKAKEHYQKGCDLKYGFACQSLGYLYEKKFKNDDQAQKYYKLSCELEVAAGCSSLKAIYKKQGVPMETVEAVETEPEEVDLGNCYYKYLGKELGPFNLRKDKCDSLGIILKAKSKATISLHKDELERRSCDYKNDLLKIITRLTYRWESPHKSISPMELKSLAFASPQKNKKCHALGAMSYFNDDNFVIL